MFLFSQQQQTLVLGAFVCPFFLLDAHARSSRSTQTADLRVMLVLPLMPSAVVGVTIEPRINSIDKNNGNSATTTTTMSAALAARTAPVRVELAVYASDELLNLFLVARNDVAAAVGGAKHATTSSSSAAIVAQLARFIVALVDGDRALDQVRLQCDDDGTLHRFSQLCSRLGAPLAPRRAPPPPSTPLAFDARRGQLAARDLFAQLAALGLPRWPRIMTSVATVELTLGARVGALRLGVSIDRIFVFVSF